MKLKPEIEKVMIDKSTDYIDWEELYHGDRLSDLYNLKSGSLEAAAFCDGFKHAIAYLSINGLINKE